MGRIISILIGLTLLVLGINGLIENVDNAVNLRENILQIIGEDNMKWLSWQDEAILEFKTQGYVVVVFDPKELKGANPDLVEERLIHLGYDVINQLKGDTHE